MPPQCLSSRLLRLLLPQYALITPAYCPDGEIEDALTHMFMQLTWLDMQLTTSRSSDRAR